MKKALQNGFQECSQHLYSRWRKRRFAQGTFLKEMQPKCLYCSVFRRNKVIQGTSWNYHILHTVSYAHVGVRWLIKLRCTKSVPSVAHPYVRLFAALRILKVIEWNSPCVIHVLWCRYNAKNIWFEVSELIFRDSNWSKWSVFHTNWHGIFKTC